MSRASGAALVTVLALAACSGAGKPSTPVAAASPHATATTRAASPVALTIRRGVLTLPTVGRLSSAWSLALTIRYGAAPDLLGQADTNGGRTAPIGPTDAVPASDGSWWLIDANKHRLAHYAASGSYLGEVPIPGRHADIVDLHVFADGSMWAQNGVHSDDSVVSDGRTARRVNLEGAQRIWSYDDGRTAYALRPRGSGPAPRVPTVQVVSGQPVLGQTDWAMTAGGQRFAVYLQDSGGALVVELPDASPPTKWVLTYRAAVRPQLPVLAAVEWVTDRTGTVHLLVGGQIEGSSPTEVGGYFTIDRNARLSQLEPTASLHSPADPGGGEHLQLRPGSTTPSIVLIGPDATRVFTRR